MSWIIASVPCWFLGALLASCGIYALLKSAGNHTSVPAFNSIDDGEAIMVGFGMVFVSIPLLCLAA